LRPHFRALIADDERLLREQLCDCLASVWPELEIVAQARNGLFPMGPEDKYLVELPDTGIKAHIALGLQCRRLAERLENEPPPLE
jgi:DNA-binding LytR/AlgR family response regulator